MTTSQRSSGRHALPTDPQPYAIPRQAAPASTGRRYRPDAVWTAPTPADYLPTVTVAVPAQRPAVEVPAVRAEPIQAQPWPSRAERAAAPVAPAVVEPRRRQVLTYLLAGAVVLIAVVGTAVNTHEPAAATATVTTPAGQVQP